MIEVTGIEELKAKLSKLVSVADSADIAMAMAEVIFDESQDRVPVDTGELKASGAIRQEGDDAVVEYLAPHAAHVEYGTSRMAAQPFLRESSQEKIVVPAVIKKLREKGLPD